MTQSPPLTGQCPLCQHGTPYRHLLFLPLISSYNDNTLRARVIIKNLLSIVFSQYVEVTEVEKLMKKIDWLQIVVHYISYKENGHHALAHNLGSPFIELTNKIKQSIHM